MEKEHFYGEHGGLGAGSLILCNLRYLRAGYYIRPKCAERIPHRPGVPCREERCPKCGVVMLREGSPEYFAWLKVKEEKEKK